MITSINNQMPPPPYESDSAQMPKGRIMLCQIGKVAATVLAVAAIIVLIVATLGFISIPFLATAAAFYSKPILIIVGSIIIKGYWFIALVTLNYIQEKLSLVFSGSQDQCNGTIDTKKVNNKIKKLNENVPKSVVFNNSLIESQLQGGTCSAMSLSFTSKLFNLQEKNPEASIKSLILKNLDAFKKFAQSSEKFRNRQMAYNTINLVKFDSIDVTHAKIQSLVRDRHLEAEPVCDNLELNSNQVSLRNIPFENGIYFVRVIRPAVNHKMEKYGHSMIYIHEGSDRFFYDPSVGLKEIGSNYSHQLLEKAKECNEKWGTNILRIYRLTRPSSP